MKEFKEYIADGIVRQQHKDISRADSLMLEARQRRSFLQDILDKFGVSDKNANYVVEACYDIIMELIRSNMLRSGFSASGSYAHEAEVAFLKTLNYPESDMAFLDTLRYRRNGINYYGKITTKEYALQVLKFMEKAYKKLIV